jgi:hypothetical protein
MKARIILVLVLGFGFGVFGVNGATITSAASGNWNATGTWSPAQVPVAGDIVTILNGHTVTVTATAACAQITINSGAILTVNRNLTVSAATSITGRINFGSTNATSRTMTFTGDVTLNSGAIWNETATLAIPTFSFGGNFTNNATTFTALTGVHTFTGANKTFSGATLTSIPRVTISGTYTNNVTLNVVTALAGTGGLTNGAAGTLNIGGTVTITVLTAIATGNTVNYTGVAQTAKVTSYYNLTLSGSLIKTFATAPTVSNILSMEGTATVVVTTGVVTYGTAATLQYNTATARTATAEEWITPFAATGGVKIASTGIITMNVAKVFNSNVPLTINSGASLATNNLQVTFGGNFSNSGTFSAGSSPIVITNTFASQSIAGFTTTGLVSMTKTGGTATLTGNVNGAGLTINGSGGTLSLGTGFTHTFTGIWTRTIGTVLGGTSTIRLGSSVTNTAGTFTCETGTVEYYASAIQTIAPITYNNLTLSGTSAKTFPAGTTTVGGTLSLEGSVTTTVTGTLSYGGGATLQYKGSVAQTTGAEFPAVWASTGGIKIENANGVTLNGARTFTPAVATSTSLSIGSVITNSIFNDGGNQLTVTTPGGGAGTTTFNLNSGTFKLGAGMAATTFPTFSSNTFGTVATVEYAATATQTIKGLTYSNLTISGSGTNDKTADANITVNGVLNLVSGNGPTTLTETKGCLDMSTFTLIMGATATTIGTGDVTGIVERTQTFAVNTPYTFGNQYTTISMAAGGTLPSSISVKIVLSTSHSFMAGAIHRYYDIIQTGGNAATKVTLNLHYLTSEINTATEGNLDLFDGSIDPLTDRGRSNFNLTDKWVGLANLPLTTVAPYSDYNINYYWTLATSATPICTWLGLTTNWIDDNNWTGGAPTSVKRAIIPNAINTTNDPILPTSTSVGFISIKPGGIIYGGSGTLTIAGGPGAWDNLGTFIPEASTIIFTHSSATLADTTNFNNVTVANGASLTLGTDNIMRISGVLSLSTSGVLNAGLNHNTVEYNGVDQTVVSPNGSTSGYHNLILSGSGGIKTMPGALNIGMDFTLAGTATANASGALTVVGNVTLGSGTTFNAGSYTHAIAGNWINNGATFTAGTSTLNFNSTLIDQSISGTASQTFNAISITKSSKTLSAIGSTTTLYLKDLTISSGIFSPGTATTLNLAGNWSNTGTFTPGSGTVVFNGTSAQTLSNANTFNNLTINTSAGVTAGDGQTVNGVLYLQSANASATKGTLDMGSYVLTMGSTATTIGIGDVTGTVTRNSFAYNTPYTFGNRYTTMNFTFGTLPTSISFKLVLTLPNTWKSDAINRYYDITRVGGASDTRLTLNVHYLDTELNGVTEANMDFFDIVPPSTVIDRGHSDHSAAGDWISLGGLGLTYVANTTADYKYWTLGTNSTGNSRTWISGGAVLTDWTLPGNWNGGIPDANSDVTIPSGKAAYPTLPDNITVNTLDIQSGGTLNATGSQTLTIAGGAGAWVNNGTFNTSGGSTTVIFTNAAATMMGTSNFINLTVNDGASLTLETNSFLTVSGLLSLSTTGMMNAAANINTVEYNGAVAQAIINPNGSTVGYHNLILSGGGVKTMPSTLLNIAGTLSIEGNASVLASQDIVLTGNLSIGTGTDFDASSYNLSIGGNWSQSGTGVFTANTGTVYFTSASAQTITGSNTFNNLTISGSGGITAIGDQTVNGILNLASANPSATKGLLEMTRDYANYPGTLISHYLYSYLLNMGTSATTIGMGDVTGTIKRATIDANTAYTFGNQYTTITLTSGAMPDGGLKVSVTIGATAPGNHDAIARTYEIVPVLSDAEGFTPLTTNVLANFHYLDSELTSTISTYHLNTEAKMVTMDYDIAGGTPTADEHGRSNYDFTNNYIGFSNIPLSYFIQKSNHLWRTVFELRDFQTAYLTWDGSTSTSWSETTNWTPDGAPSDLTHIIIPDALTTPRGPVLPSTADANTLTIENGGVLEMGSNTLTIHNSLSGGWEDQNAIGNDPGSSTVIFAHPGTSISGNARFYNVEIGTGADITNQTGSTMKIAGTMTKTGTWHADIFNNTVEYSGGAQTVVTPDGSGAYYNLSLSGTLAKTIATTLNTLGDFNLSGAATVTAGGIYTIGGNITLGSGTTFDAGSNTHAVSGNWINNGATFTIGTSTINFNSTSVDQSISGTDASQTFNAISVNKSSKTLSISGSTTTLNLKDLTVATGTLDPGTATNINITGTWANSGTFAPLGGTVTFNGTSAQALNGSSSFYNLTVNNGTGVTAGNDQTVNGTLNLQTANASSTKGSLDMSSFILDLGLDAVNTGIGDVSGIVRRNTLASGIAYTFGNPYTTLTLASGGVLPSSMNIKLILAATTAFKPGAINRYYDIIRTGGDAATKVTLSLHYLDAELNGNAKGSMDLFDGISAPMTDDGHSGFDNANYWVSLSSLDLTYVGQSGFDTKYWTLGNAAPANYTWIGTTDVWATASNWVGGIVPGPGNPIIIPNAATTANDPTLPSTTIGSIAIQSGGVLNGGAETLTLDGAGVTWNNLGTFTAGTSSIIFTNAAATISGTTDFNNITVAHDATLTPATGNIMRIGGTFSLSDNGILYASSNSNTIDYNGSNQNVVTPSGTPATYSNLYLSGSGTKTLPGVSLAILGDFALANGVIATATNDITVTGNWNSSGTFSSSGGAATFDGSAQTITGTNTFNNLTLTGSLTKTLPASPLQVSGNLTLSGTAAAVASDDISVSGNVTLGSGTFFNAGSYTHSISGNWTDNGSTFTPGTSTINFINTSALQTISASSASRTFNTIQVAKSAQTLIIGGSITAIVLNGGLTITSGTFDAGTAANISVAGGWANTGTYTAGTGTVTLNGSSAQSVSGTSTFYDLTLSSTGVKTFTAGSATTVSHTLTNSTGSAAGVVLASGATSDASLIHATAINATVQRYITIGKWHIMSIPVSGQVIGSFLTNSANSIGYNSLTFKYGMMPYLPTTNVWGSFYDGTESGAYFNIGEGYMMRRKSSGADGVVTAAGTLLDADLPVTTVAGKWNCVGNPFTSAIAVTEDGKATNNFLAVNNLASRLDASYAVLYVWDQQPGYSGPTRSDYKIIGPSGYLPKLTKNFIQAGQGFLVKTNATTGSSVAFTLAMRDHQVSEAYVKKSAPSWPGFELVASDTSTTINTIVTFEESMTKGLDPSYDAGVLKGNSYLSLYTKLVEDNGVEFAIQCLPLTGLETFVIPVGVDFPSGGEITFTAITDLAPAGGRVILEDRLLGTYTDMVANTNGYKVNLPANTSGTGRFFLHTGDVNVGVPVYTENALQVYASGKKIYINGEVSAGSNISLYSIQGTLLKTFSPQGSLYRQLDADGLLDGIYILRISDKQTKKSYKLFLGNGL